MNSFYGCRAAQVWTDTKERRENHCQARDIATQSVHHKLLNSKINAVCSLVDCYIDSFSHISYFLSFQGSSWSSRTPWSPWTRCALGQIQCKCFFVKKAVIHTWNWSGHDCNSNNLLSSFPFQRYEDYSRPGRLLQSFLSQQIIKIYFVTRSLKSTWNQNVFDLHC